MKREKQRRKNREREGHAPRAVAIWGEICFFLAIILIMHISCNHAYGMDPLMHYDYLLMTWRKLLFPNRSINR